MRDEYEEYLKQRHKEMEERNRNFKRGLHTNHEGKVFDIREMDEAYLRSVIKTFGPSGYDIEPLKNELKKRQPNTLKKSVRILAREGVSKKNSPKKRGKAKKAGKSLLTYLKSVVSG